MLLCPVFLQDLGMESTSLDDVLYRYASFRNLVDPITHDLIISLARYIHCPKPVGATVSSRSGTVLAWETGNVELLLECQGKILSVFGGFGSRGSGFAAEQVIFGDYWYSFWLVCGVFKLFLARDHPWVDAWTRRHRSPVFAAHNRSLISCESVWRDGIKAKKLFRMLKKEYYACIQHWQYYCKDGKVVKELQMIEGPQKMLSEERFKHSSDDFILNCHVSARKERKYWALKSSSIL